MRRIGLISLLVFFAVALSLSLTFCSFSIGSRTKVTKPASRQPVAAAPKVMPDLVGKPLHEAARTLSGHRGGLFVSLPAVTATYSIGPDKVSELGDPPRIETYEIAARRVRLMSRLTRSSEHTVTSQSVAPGAALTTATEIVFELGPHPGCSGAEPWVLTHLQAVRQAGADPCFECHQPTACARCHTNMQL